MSNHHADAEVGYSMDDDRADSYAECTCGHYWENHDEAGCQFVGCGCAR